MFWGNFNFCPLLITFIPHFFNCGPNDLKFLKKFFLSTFNTYVRIITIEAFFAQVALFRVAIY